MVVILPSKILLYFTIWLSGISILHLKSKILPIYLSFIIFASTLIISRIHLIDNLFVMDVILSISFILLVNSFMYSKESKLLLTISKLNEKLSHFSYSLYLLHMPFVYLAVYCLHHYTNINFAITSNKKNTRSK